MGPNSWLSSSSSWKESTAFPEFRQAGAVTTVPMSSRGNTSRFDVEGHPKNSGGQEYEANTPTVSQNYFSLMGIPLRAGRFFSSQDRDQSTHVVVVNQAMADMVFPSQDAIGKRINFTYTNETHYVQIVGVVANENVDSLDAPPTPIVYDCYEQDPGPYFSLVVRTKQEPASLAAAVTRAVHELEPQAPIFKVSSMAQIISTAPAMIVRAYPAYLIGGFSALALLLAALGLYGVLAYSVAQRARELGLRMALGAQRGDLLRMVVRSGLKLAVIGIAFGIAGGLRHRAADCKSAVWRSSHGCRYFCGCVCGAFRGRHDGQLHSGLSRDQSRSHGGVAKRVSEESIMTGLLQDVRYGLRMLWKRPGFTAVAVITLALGIGANTTTFNTVNAMLLRPFPFPGLDRIVTVWETAPKQNDYQLSPAPANFRDWSEQSKEIEQLAAVRGWDANLTRGNVAEHVEGSQVTENFFSLLGMSPQLGRYIGRADFQDGVAPVVVISHGFWQQHLGADPGHVGRQLLLNGQKFTVVGITSADFDFPTGSKVWTPLDLNGPAKEDRENHYLTVFGRLKDGVSIPQAQANVETIAASLGRQYPRSNAGHGVRVRNTVEDLTVGSRQFVLMLMGAAVFVLLLACANVANLQLARASGRQREIALRAALGASRWQVGRQLLVESVLLALLGSGMAILLSGWWLNIIRSTIPPFIVEHIAGLKHLQVDLRVFMFTVLIAVATGILAGLAPAWHFSRPDVNDTLKESARGGSANCETPALSHFACHL